MSMWISRSVSFFRLWLTVALVMGCGGYGLAAVGSANDEQPLAASGTLPVMFIETAGGAEISSKETYVNATFHITVPDGFPASWAAGTAADPLPLKIRGRGNWTWTFDKKPYKVKLPRPMALLGMGANRHWALLSHPEDGTGFLRNAVGFEVGRLMGLPFTPHQQPVELFLNGEYLGIYVVTETVRVDENRVEIEPQADGETGAEAVKKGWLVEIDNYEDENQISFNVAGLPIDDFRITWHTPERLSQVQHDYLHGEFSDILKHVCTVDKQSQAWESYLDIDMLARYYVTAEIIDHVEAFFGSTFLYKATAEGKWMTGPLWDLGHALNGWHSKDQFIYEGLSWGSNLLTELCKFPRFQQKAKEYYAWFMREHYDAVETFIDDYCAMLDQAYHANYLRWPYYGDRTGAEYAAYAKQTLRAKIAFLDKQWGRETSVSPLPTSLRRGGDSLVYDLQGRKAGQRMNTERHGKIAGNGIYIINGKKIIIK